MNKSDFVEALAKEGKLKKADAARAVDAFAKVVEDELMRGREIRLVNFGTFYVADRKATEARNPRTGDPIKIPATRVPRFKAGKGLKSSVAGH